LRDRCHGSHRNNAAESAERRYDTQRFERRAAGLAIVIGEDADGNSGIARHNVRRGEFNAAEIVVVRRNEFDGDRRPRHVVIRDDHARAGGVGIVRAEVRVDDVSWQGQRRQEQENGETKGHYPNCDGISRSRLCVRWSRVFY